MQDSHLGGEKNDAGQQSENDQDGPQEYFHDHEIAAHGICSRQAVAVDMDMRQRPQRHADHSFKNAFDPGCDREKIIKEGHERNYIIQKNPDPDAYHAEAKCKGYEGIRNGI